MKKWETLNKLKVEDVIEILLENRGLTTQKDIEEFLFPKLENVTAESVAIDKKQLGKAVKRIEKAIKEKEHVVVFGDYDVDGIAASAILWETLHSMGAQVIPYIPHRIDEGYGLSVKGISNVQLKMQNVKLIITVDNGIVANEAVDFANKQGIDVIVTDHHVPSAKLPDAHAIVHTTKLCGAGVAWLLAQEIKRRCHPERSEGSPSTLYSASWDSSSRQGGTQNDKIHDDQLELVALATIADLVPLTGANRVLTTFGLKKLRETKRVGLLELYKEAALNPSTIGVYEVGHIIAPRINAMGRLEYAMESLRLLCTKNSERARLLAEILGRTNRERQGLTQESVLHAKQFLKDLGKDGNGEMKKLLFIAHESYQQGVIGLVAGKLVEEFYRPAIVISKGEVYSKASARSVHGFNIIEFIRSASEYLVDAGGHPMAAGFTVETSKLSILQQALEKLAHVSLDKEKLTRTIRIDCELPLEQVAYKLYDALQKLAPFGMGNPEPTFVSRNVEIADMRLVGVDKRHIKIRCRNAHCFMDGIGFGLGEKASEFHIGDSVDVVYTIDEDTWGGNRRLQLKVKDIRRTN